MSSDQIYVAAKQTYSAAGCDCGPLEVLNYTQSTQTLSDGFMTVLTPNSGKTGLDMSFSISGYTNCTASFKVTSGTVLGVATSTSAPTSKSAQSFGMSMVCLVMMMAFMATSKVINQ
jgi:hypothetical protein